MCPCQGYLQLYLMDSAIQVTNIYFLTLDCSFYTHLCIKRYGGNGGVQ